MSAILGFIFTYLLANTICHALPNIHKQMSAHQLQSVFHVEHADAVPQYEVVQLLHHHTHAADFSATHNRRRRSINTAASEHGHHEHVKKDLSKNAYYSELKQRTASGENQLLSDVSAIKEHKVSFSAFGEHKNLTLRPTQGLFKNSPHALRMFSIENNPNATQGVDLHEIFAEHDSKHEIGEVFQDEANMAAILMRRHMQTGDLLMEGSIGHDMVIKPLPHELSNSQDEVQHVVYRRQSEQNDHLSDFAFMEPDDLAASEKLESLQRRQKRAAAASARSFKDFDDLNEDDIEGALEADDDVGGYETAESRKRSKRQAPYIIYPEVLVIVDYDGYRLHGGDNLQVKRYFISFWNGVDLRYRVLKGPKIRISIAGIIISRGRDATPYLERNRVGRDAIDSAAALTDMGKYLFRERRLPVYDIAVAITKLDMCRRTSAYGECNRGTAGFAYVGGACVVNKRLEKVNSVAIIEDTGGFSGIIVAAHEVGHLLGAVHDGSPPPSYLGGPGAQRCRWEDGYIMSDLRHTERGFRWSPCTVQSFHHFLNGETATCLHNAPHEDSALGRSLPGTLLSLDAQCRRDRGTYACFKDERVCAQLFCFDAQTGYCVAYRPAAEGSQCGSGLHCLDGRCTPLPSNIIPDYGQYRLVYNKDNTNNGNHNHNSDAEGNDTSSEETDSNEEDTQEDSAEDTSEGEDDTDTEDASEGSNERSSEETIRDNKIEGTYLAKRQSTTTSTPRTTARTTTTRTTKRTTTKRTSTTRTTTTKRPHTTAKTTRTTTTTTKSRTTKPKSNIYKRTFEYLSHFFEPFNKHNHNNKQTTINNSDNNNENNKMNNDLERHWLENGGVVVKTSTKSSISSSSGNGNESNLNSETENEQQQQEKPQNEHETHNTQIITSHTITSTTPQPGILQVYTQEFRKQLEYLLNLIQNQQQQQQHQHQEQPKQEPQLTQQTPNKNNNQENQISNYIRISKQNEQNELELLEKQPRSNYSVTNNNNNKDNTDNATRHAEQNATDNDNNDDGDDDNDGDVGDDGTGVDIDANVATNEAFERQKRKFLNEQQQLQQQHNLRETLHEQLLKLQQLQLAATPTPTPTQKFNLDNITPTATPAIPTIAMRNRQFGLRTTSTTSTTSQQQQQPIKLFDAYYRKLQELQQQQKQQLYKTTATTTATGFGPTPATATIAQQQQQQSHDYGSALLKRTLNPSSKLVKSSKSINYQQTQIHNNHQQHQHQQQQQQQETAVEQHEHTSPAYVTNFIGDNTNHSPAVVLNEQQQRVQQQQREISTTASTLLGTQQHAQLQQQQPQNSAHADAGAGATTTTLRYKKIKTQKLIRRPIIRQSQQQQQQQK